MLTRILLSLVAAAALAGSAAAAPALVVRSAPKTGAVAPATIVTREAPGTYRTTISLPAAYTISTAVHDRTQIGTAAIDVATASGTLAFHGFLLDELPSNFALDQCASYAGVLHRAVWLMELRQDTGIASAEIPVYVDYGAGGSTELTWCASAAADMTVTQVSLTLAGALRAPAVPGAYAWRAAFDNLSSAGSRSVLGAPAAATAVVRVHR